MTIFTIGHSTHPIEEFIRILKAYDIQTLVDIRTIPRSRYNPQFSQEALKASLDASDIRYRYLKELGGRRKAKADSPNTGFRDGGFRGYADHMMTDEFKRALRTLIGWTKVERVAIMCAESSPSKCHRSLVADALTARHIPVENILSETKSQPHALTSFAKLEGETICYPKEEPQYSLL